MATRRKKISKRRIPILLIPLIAGVMIGLMGYLFYISKAYSYLSDNPKACVNCHIMAPEYATWNHSSHGRNTVCNDCHIPHDNVFRTYFLKPAMVSGMPLCFR